MKLTAEDLIKDLLAGTLSNELDRFTNKEGELLDSKKSTLFLYINEGLKKLYSQYRLKEDDLYLAAVEGKTDYEISTEHFMEHWDAPSYDKYLWKDDSKPWEDNLLQIMSVTDHHGITLPMNDGNNPFSVWTPEYNVIQIPVHPSGEYPILRKTNGDYWFPSNPLGEPYEDRTHEMVYSVKFLANHKKITSLTDNIVIPPHLLDVLTSFISSRIYSNMNTELAVSNAAKYDQNYRLALQEITQESLIQPENSGLNNKFEMRGFR